MPSKKYVTKDSGKRTSFTSGMVRDTDEGKPRYDLIPVSALKRLAELYARGARKYGDRNWEQANSPEELQRFKASFLRHAFQWLAGEDDEDHAIAAVWNIFAALTVQDKLYPSHLVDTAQALLEEIEKHKNDERLSRVPVPMPLKRMPSLREPDEPNLPDYGDGFSMGMHRADVLMAPDAIIADLEETE